MVDLEEGDGVAIDPELLQEVEVTTQQLEGRQRQIDAKIQIPHPVEPIWNVLTDYEALADFIPNLAKSERLTCPEGGIRLEQVGTQRVLRFNFSARVVLDMEERFPEEIRFNMVEGDFKAFSGCWCLQPLASDDSCLTNLCYTVVILPKRFMPISMIERRLQKDMAVNLLAIRQRVSEIADC
ncbi:MAG: SRPBCC family protein [Scytolyngbya sp. HA4215-MV1]|nr:SRPBCC family protein [Scytolyngbya sp. HA4215-MV1]